MGKRLGIMVAVAWVCGIARAEFRDWTLEDGRVIQAEFVALIGGDVSLRNDQGRTIKVPLDRLSAEDAGYVDLQQPPTLQLDFSKVSEQRIFPYSLSPLPRAFYYHCKARIRQTSTRPYGQQLLAEVFLIGEEIYGGKQILLDYQQGSFLLEEGSGSSFELQCNTVQLMEYVIGGYKGGTKYGGYLIVVTDPRGEVVGYQTTDENLYGHLDSLRHVPIGKTFDEECNRCMPTRPHRFY